MRINHTRERLAAGETVFGCALQHYRSAEIPRAFAAAGFHYVFIDMEHSGFDFETVQDMIAAAASSSITPIVRVGELLYSLVARLLDVGAQGIIFPRVESPELLAEAVSWTRFPPLGKRGFGMMAPVLDYQPATFPAIMEHQNGNTTVVVQFESRLALERTDELLSVPGVDVAMIGPSDLSISLGVPGQADHPLLVDSVTQFIARCEAHGVVPGIHCRNAAQARFWTELGMRFVGSGGEHGLLLEKAKEVVASLCASAAQK
ncbi:MAG: HpcH/HpaI aldolase family protein [Bryobacteraceae bacterium]